MEGAGGRRGKGSAVEQVLVLELSPEQPRWRMLRRRAREVGKSGENEGVKEGVKEGRRGGEAGALVEMGAAIEVGVPTQKSKERWECKYWRMSNRWRLS